MLYAKVVLGLAVEGPFDYIVPAGLSRKIKVGSRVWVNFRNKKALGYVVKITKKTNIKNLKSISTLIDDTPVLNKKMLLLTRRLADYYCCSWGEAIETALPDVLRKGRILENVRESPNNQKNSIAQAILIHALDNTDRWDIYINEIKMVLENNKSVIVILPDIQSVRKAQKLINERLRVSSGILYRKQRGQLEEWRRIKEGKIDIILGTRSGIFAPFNNPGLVIIDEEGDSVYKQEQVPHYNAREVAFMRIKIERAKLILGGTSPSLESLHLAQKNKIEYKFIPRIKGFPEIKIIDMKSEYYRIKQRNIILSKYLEDSVISVLNSKGKILLFLNRKGFATSAYCHNCGIALKCTRCNINLVYHFKENLLICRYCNFKMHSPSICPNCNSGYIKYAGAGTEKIESELSRIFAQARIKRLESQERLDIKDADIFVATSSIIKQTDYNFDLIGVLLIDNALNRIDFRSSEKAFALLVGLLGLTEKKMVIETSLPHHHCFQALIKKDLNLFYEEESKQRRQLNFPPYRHMILVKLRGLKDERVKEASYALFERLNQCNKNKGIKIVSVNPGQPAKLRGNFYWQLLIISDNVIKVSEFLKINLKNFRHSGIIVTVDVDPL